ncbi:MAG: SdiA-regulated domain-containing protein, partial [Gemmatimonadaceae bacterium]
PIGRSPLQKATVKPPPVALLEWFDLHRNAATRVALPQGLREVSGLAATADQRVFAHGDEFGVVAQIDPATGNATKRFSLGSPAIRGDFEGIAIVGERFFLVTSNGRLYETREGANGAGMPFTVLDTGFGKTCEIEGLAWEPADRVLLVGCKTVLASRRSRTVTIFRWALDQKRPATPDRLTLDLADVPKSTGVTNVRVSSIEHDPRTGHLLAIAGPAWQLVELTKEGRVVAARGLSRHVHLQPEGMTILGDSLLLIADEGGRGRASLTRYRRAR